MNKAKSSIAAGNTSSYYGLAYRLLKTAYNYNFSNTPAPIKGPFIILPKQFKNNSAFEFGPYRDIITFLDKPHKNNSGFVIQESESYSSPTSIQVEKNTPPKKRTEVKRKRLPYVPGRDFEDSWTNLIPAAYSNMTTQEKVLGGSAAGLGTYMLLKKLFGRR